VQSCFADAIFWLQEILNYVHWRGTEGNLGPKGWEFGTKRVASGIPRIATIRRNREMFHQQLVHFVQIKEKKQKDVRH